MDLCFLLRNPHGSWDLGPSGWQWRRNICEQGGARSLEKGLERRWAGAHSLPSGAKSC